MTRENNSKLPVNLEEPEYEVYADDTDPEAIRTRLTEALRRESFNLLSEASQGTLGRDRSAALIGYLKYLNQLEELQKDKAEKLSDEELEKLANESK